MWGSIFVEGRTAHGCLEGVSNILEVQAEFAHQSQVLALKLSSNDTSVQQPLKAV